jgi:class 3 adenylate cyclase
VPTADERALEAAGLFETPATEAAERRALLGHLRDAGCTVEEMVSAHAAGRLFAIVGDRTLVPGRASRSLREMSDEHGWEPELVRRFWRALRLPEAGDNDRVASTGDETAIATLVAMADFAGVDRAVGLARVIASACERAAEATAAAARSSTASAAVATSDELQAAQYWERAAALAVAVGAAMDANFRHQVELSRRRFEVTDSYDVMTRRQSRLAVCFLDISGYTAMSEALAPEALSSLLDAFERAVDTAIVGIDVRVVKFIGDAVLLVSPSADLVVRVATGLVVDRSWAHPLDPRLRAGVAYGEVLTQEGDVFGPPVNVAARLLGVAAPGRVVATGPACDRLVGDWPLRRLPDQSLRGVDGPVPVNEIAPT